MLIQILLVLGFVLALWITWKRYRQNIISLVEALAWSILWLGGAIVSLLPKLTEYLAAFFGVGRGVDLILYAAVAIQFFLIFKLFISHERLERNLTKIVQENALHSLSANDSHSVIASEAKQSIVDRHAPSDSARDDRGEYV